MKKILAALIILAMAVSLSACSGGGSSDYKIGLGVVTGIHSSSSKTDEAGPVGQVDSLIAAVTVDANGKIQKCWIDAAQTTVEFDAEGIISSDVNAEIRSKYEKKEDYGMVRYNASAIQKEWYQQADAFAAWCVGKTAADVTGLKTKARDEEHTSVPDIPELTSTVTISVADFQKAVAKAVANAR
ncbi:MAG: hypothetical protein LBT59_04625 [Clostridiales bacterium]|nr:hypothetical protein [Clostridiales bacterium]